jgi:hypothetical protein
MYAMTEKDSPLENLQNETFRFYETHAESLIERSRLRNGILFNDYTEDQFQAVPAEEKSLRLLNMWKSPDLPPARPDREWLHVLAQKHA